MLNDFSNALAFVLGAEGGLSDDPDDPGGRTNKGIENREYATWLQSQGLPVVDVSQITDDQAAQIYRLNYWNPVHGDYVASQTAYALFDGGVNQGVGTVLGFLQRVLGIPLSGEFDDNTSAAYHAWFNAGHSDEMMANGILSQRVVHYRQLVVDNPNLGKFLDGWLNRVAQLRNVIAKLP